MRHALIFGLILLAAALDAQTGPGTSNYVSGVRYVLVAPSGSCVASVHIQAVIGSGALYSCQTGTWAQVSGGSASMTWPATPGIPVCTGTPCTAYGTSIPAPDSNSSHFLNGASGWSSPTVVAGKLPGNYQVYISGGTVYAQNNLTGVIDYSGADAAVVFNDILGAGATTGGTIYIKNGVYPLASATAETATNCPYYYSIGIPSNVQGSSVEWNFIGEASPVWRGESLATTIETNGVIFNVTSAAVTAAGSSFLMGIWQRPQGTTGSDCNIIGGNLNNILYFENVGIRFPTNQRGNEGGIVAWSAITVHYRNVLADFNLTYHDIATGSAPVAGAVGSFGLTSTTSTSGNVQWFESTYVTGYDTCYDFNSEHILSTFSTAIYCNYAGVIGRNRQTGVGLVAHPVMLQEFIDQENLHGLQLGSNMAQGSRVDMYALDIELGTDGNWYNRSTAAMTEANSGYTAGNITYTAVKEGGYPVPLGNLFSSGGGSFQQTNTAITPVSGPMSDSFTRADSASLGGNWVDPGYATYGPMTIASNTAHCTSTYCAALFVGQLSANNQSSKVTVSAIDSSATSTMSVRTNMLNSATKTLYGYYCSHSAATGSGIAKFVSGTPTILASQSSTAGCNAGDTIELDHIGTKLYALRNGVLDANLTPNPVTDATLSGGQPGLEVSEDTTGGVAATNWSGGSLPTPLAMNPAAGHASCILSAGPPVIIGYCSSVVASDGTCTCN